jgi:hypothetical protein
MEFMVNAAIFLGSESINQSVVCRLSTLNFRAHGVRGECRHLARD